MPKGILNLMFVLSAVDNVADIMSLLSQVTRIGMRLLLSKGSVLMRMILTWSLLVTFVTDIVGPSLVLMWAKSGLHMLESLKDSLCFSVGMGYETLIATHEQFESIEQFNWAMLGVGVLGMAAELAMLYQEMKQDPTVGEALASVVSVLASLSESLVGILDMFGNILKAVEGMDAIESAILNVKPLSKGHVCVQLNPDLDAPSDHGVVLNFTLALICSGLVLMCICVCSCPPTIMMKYWQCLDS